MKLDILFLGKLFPKEFEVTIKSKMKTGMQDAANALQWHIIDGLEANDCGQIKILNYLPVDSYPKGYTDSRIERFIFQHTDKYQADDLNVGCTNLTIVKQFCNQQPFKREIKKWAKTDNGGKKVVMLYTASCMFLELVKYAKSCNDKIAACCIIADIPEFVTARDLHGVRKLYSDFTVKKSNALYKYIDKFVLLTKQMAEKLNITVPFCVVEGIATNTDAPADDTLAKQYENDKYILYTGTLNYKFGIGNLLEAFSMVPDKDIKLIVCGFGEAEKSIIEQAKVDKRIIYLGRVERKQVLALQRKATVLVNPRQNNEEFTKYSFPSKNLEYLSSGIPLVAYKLDGIPDEYDEYINYVQDDSPESLAAKLVEICSMDEQSRKEMGKRGADFVLKNKNARVQTRHILEFLAECSKGEM